MLPFRAALALLLAVAAAPLAGGCAKGNEHVDPCERAVQRLVEECGYDIEGVEDLELNCTGPSACVGVCLEEAPCEDIAANDGEFAKCTAGCQ